MDVPDKWLKTPLHYAAQRGASICQIYLFKRGVNKESVDIYGNTPLGISLLCKHHNSAIIMIQKNANVCALVYQETPEEIARKWKEEESKNNKEVLQDQIMQDDEATVSDPDSDDDKMKKKHRGLFDKNKNNMYGDYGDEDYYDEEEDEDSDDQFEMNAFNANNAFN